MSAIATVRPNWPQRGDAAIWHPDGSLTTMGHGVVHRRSPYQPGDWVEYHAGGNEPAPRNRCFDGFVLGGQGSTLLRGVTTTGAEWCEHTGSLNPPGRDRPERCVCRPIPAWAAKRTAEPEQLDLFDLAPARPSHQGLIDQLERGEIGGMEYLQQLATAGAFGGAR